ncbi:Glycosyltransferase involved in cell wall bisynthesis [Paucidesulfovibrio gracilis DSM 16080]|uniref:Glycosyltransferase involved in cell wall bisynthesis n=2 Tax=Paucidesulfovibrio TaxID=2910985 RepID=A0A1T4W358_9BACT|nr:Glycosyltransferase involved in cell wall bisynthesis [Paucidesulfovibrio gracilis DSM 16080]
MVSKRRTGEEPEAERSSLGCGRRVCMFVFNNFTHDSRVLKEAKTLTEQGYDVRVVAFKDKTTASREIVEGFRVIRVVLDPPHLRMLARLRRRGSTSFLAAFANLLTSFWNFFLSGFSKIVRLVSHAMSTMFSFLKVAIARIAAVLRWVVLKFLYLAFGAGVNFVGSLLFVLRLAVGRGGAGDAFVMQSALRGQTSKLYWHRLTTAFSRAGIALQRRVNRYCKTLRGRLEGGIVLCKRVVQRRYAQIRQWRVRRGNQFQNWSYEHIKQFVLRYHRPLCFQNFYANGMQAVADEPADIYQAHDLNTLPVAWWLARKHKAKLVYDSHELYLNRNRTKPRGRINDFLLASMEKFLIRRCHAAITVNDTIAKELAVRYRIPTPHVIMNAPLSKSTEAAVESEALRRELGIPQQRFLILYCGGITFNRGLEKVIQSMALLPDCHLVFMGYGTAEYTESLLRIAEEHGVHERFDFFGPVPSDMVTTYASCADLGIAPIENVCLSYYYCSPNKVFEYLNAGLPVVASDFPEMRRVIEEFSVGGVFDPENPSDIARAITDIKENPEAARQMRANTVNAAGKFHWGNEAEKLLNIYKGLYVN